MSTQNDRDELQHLKGEVVAIKALLSVALTSTQKQGVALLLTEGTSEHERLVNTIGVEDSGSPYIDAVYETLRMISDDPT